MTYRLGLPNPDLFVGLAVLSSRVSEPDELRTRLPTQRTQPIFVAHGSHDARISVDDARETVRFLEAERYWPHYKEYPMGHEITLDVLDDLVPWIRDALGDSTE